MKKSIVKQKTNSWEEEDVKRGREQEEKGHKGHAQALFDDAHDSYNWKGGNDGHESWFHKFKKKNPVTQLKAEKKGRLVEEKINKPSTNDSLAVYMQNDYNKMYEKGEIDKPEGNWSDVAKKAEETYPGLSKAVGNTIPKGLVTGATMSNAREAREKYGLAKQKSAAPRFKDFDQMDTWDAKETAGEDSPATFKDFDQMDTWDAKSVAKQTAFQDLLKKYPDMPASDTTLSNYENMDPNVLYFAGPGKKFLDTQAAFQETYGDWDEGEELRMNNKWRENVSQKINDPNSQHYNDPKGQQRVQQLDKRINAEDARLREGANKANAARDKQALENKAIQDSTNKANSIKEKLYQDYLKSEGSAAPQNKTMAYKKSCAYRQDGHGESKGDQSATHTDYANYKGTDKGYHGKDGSSHGDQSATHRDYAHPIHKHMKR